MLRLLKSSLIVTTFDKVKEKESSPNQAELERENIPLKSGDILVYHGNLPYYINCPSENNGILIMHFVDGRNTKWDNNSL